MQNYKQQLDICRQLIEKRIHPMWNCFTDDGSDLYAAVMALSAILPNELSIYKSRLDNHILPNLRQKNPTPGFGVPAYYLSPVYFGELVSTIAYINKNNESTFHGIDWNVIHPQIILVSKERFEVEQYADAVEAAFKTINNSVKKIVGDKIPEEIDGFKLMQKAFSRENPFIPLNDMITQTDKDIQQGYQFMFAGAISGIRNPKAHNVEIISKEDAIRKLHFASMLMYKLDSRK